MCNHMRNIILTKNIRIIFLAPWWMNDLTCSSSILPLCLQQQAWAENGILKSTCSYVWRSERWWLTQPYLCPLITAALTPCDRRVATWSTIRDTRRDTTTTMLLSDFPNLQSKRTVTPHNKWICQIPLGATKRHLSVHICGVTACSCSGFSMIPSFPILETANNRTLWNTY